MKLHFRQVFDRWLNRCFWFKVGLVVIISFAVFGFSALIVRVFFKDSVPYAGELNCNKNIWWQLYYYFADPGNQMSGKDGSRVVGFIFSTLGSIFLSGILISTITNSFERMTTSWRSGFSYYKFKGHVVIIGSDQMVYGLVNQLLADKNLTIVVMTSTDVEQMRNVLWTSLTNKEDKGRIVVNYGQRDSEMFLNKINVAYASEVYLLGDTSEFDKIENYHDSLNVYCLSLISKQCKAVARTNRLKCHVLFDYKTTYHIFQYADLDTGIIKYIDFHPFNFNDFWARKVLVAGRSREGNVSYKPLDYIPITSKDSDMFVHFIVIGMSQMGQAMALQAAHIAHYPNYKKRKTKITFIDANGKAEMNEFKQKCGELFKVSKSVYIDAESWADAENQKICSVSEAENKFITHFGIAEEYRHLVGKTNGDQEFIDIEWEFINGHDNNPIVQRRLEEYVKNKNAVVTVAVCLNLTHISLRSAMHLPKAYYENDIPILVQQRKTSTLASTLNGRDLDTDKRDALLYKNITPFGMVNDCCDINMFATVEICKRIAAVYDHFFNYDIIPMQIDMNEANRIWDNTPMSKRWSNIFSAASIPTKLRCIGIEWDNNTTCRLADFTEDEISLLAEMEHNRWNIEELLLGYRPVSKTEDEEIDKDKSRKKYWKKRFVHYDIRPYDELKEDAEGRKASKYDEVIVASLPLILNFNNN